ncbi:hypothetical protein [uncultured Piscinibacter sp.]|uniref:hypothetical protein n=1 Tax=uncultured Piscinibacter sp. TaxID=1131835 RepID=UPI00261D97C2|nr:hypothetical protein [uncultured Piscinibacter sp.]
MALRSGSLRAAALCVVVTLVACASPGQQPAEGSLAIGEVLRVLTPDQVAGGDFAPGYPRAHLADWVRDRGLTEADVAAGRAIVVRHGLYGSTQDIMSLAQVDTDLAITVGNVVELRVDGAGRGHVLRVRAADLAVGGCHYEAEPAGLLDDLVGIVSLRGTRDVAVLRCQGFEAEGWTKTPGHFWTQLPGTGPRPDATPPALAPAPTGGVVQPARPPADTPSRPDLATLVVMRTDIQALSLFDVEFRVEGQQVAKLPPDHCEVVLLVPGEYVVRAGGSHGAIGPAARELRVTVRGGDRVVAEYVIDNRPQNRPGPLGFFSAAKREEAAQKIYVLTQRPAGNGDRCAILRAPQIVGPAPAEAASAPRSP